MGMHRLKVRKLEIDSNRKILLEAVLVVFFLYRKFVIVQDRFCPALIVPVACILQSGPLTERKATLGVSVIVKEPGPNITI